MSDDPEKLWRRKFPGPGECGCHKCSNAWDKEHFPDDDQLWDRMMYGRSSRFIVCEICGNKRCPHATDHELACTNSNESGQKGSIYE